MSNNKTQGLAGRLRGTLIRQRLVWVLSGLAITAAAVVGVVSLLSLAAGVAILPVWLKISLLVLSSVVALFVVARFVAARLWSGSIDQIAVRLERLYPTLKGRLVAAVQFARMTKSRGYSPDLIEATTQQALQQADGLQFSQAISYRSWKRAAKLAVMAVIPAVLLLLFWPGLFSYSYEVYSQPTSEVAPPLGYDLAAWPGSTDWIKYQDIEVGAVLVGGQFPEEATVFHRLAGGAWQETAIDLRRLVPQAGTSGDSILVRTKLRQINRSFDYYVQAGRLTTSVHQVNVVDRPRVNGIKLSLFYPRYSGLSPNVINENNGSFSALVGSRANIAIEVSQPIEKAELVFDDSTRQPMAITGRKALTEIAVSQSRAYYIELTDHLEEHNPDPIEYYVTAIPDEYPSVDVLFPGFDVNLGDDMSLPLRVRIFDDYGFSSLALKHTVFSQGQTSDENVAMINFTDRIKTEGDIDFTWDLVPFGLYPGDWITYYFEVVDNDQVSGPKASRSRQYVVRLPSLEELIAETETQSAQRIVKTEELLQEGRELTERMKQVARKMQAQQKQQKAQWQHEKELSKLAEKNAEMVQDIEKMAQQMEKSVDQLAEQSHLSREMLEKMSQIQKLFEEVATPEMKEAQRRLMEAMKNMDPQEMQKAMEEFKMSMEELMQRLERTLALLKQMQLQQKMESMLRQVEQLAERQEQMNQRADSTSSDRLPKLSPEEDQIKKSLESLKKELADLDQLAQEAELSESPEMQKFAEALRETDADQNMQQMSQAMNQQQQDQAQEEGQEALSKLLSTLDQMQQQLAAMQGGNQEEIERAMRMAIDDANYLSQKQEQLHEDASELAVSSMVLRDLASQQQDLESACQGLRHRINELGEQSPFVASELQRILNNATQCMGSATGQFGDKRKSQGMKQQREAMTNLNLAALRMMESLQQQKQCNKGGSCDKPKLNKLKSLCNKQNNLNQQTQQCQNPSSSCNNPGQGNPQFSQTGRAAMERLAGEQGSIRKSMEELANEFGDSRQVLGRLDDIARDMREIEEDLAGGEVGPETMERQLKVYSRMLQASRSLQRRDFTEQRQANTAKTDLFAAPPGLPEGFLDDSIDLEDRLRHFLSEDYPPQYEQQIRAYFKALLKLEGRTLPVPTEEPVTQ